VQQQAEPVVVGGAESVKSDSLDLLDQDVDRFGGPVGHPAAAKHGVRGLVKTFANELGAYNIRVNGVLPTHVNTAMIMHDGVYKLFRPDLEQPTKDDFMGPSQPGTSFRGSSRST
jgi:NAD(P)-dependent dehydrogenase (short-subunit alcohol dehydrogenase family)